MLKDLTGQRFYYLVVIKRAPKPDPKIKSGSAYWECKCDCGELTVVNGDNLKRGYTKSCGCSHKKFVKAILITDNNEVIWRKCSKCQIEKTINDFPNGTGHCKDCMDEYSKEYYKT